MNAIKSIVAIVLTVAAAGAFAQEATVDTAVHKSIASRQEVRDGAIAARVAGTIGYGEAAGHDFSTRERSTLSRVQVVAEAREAQRLGVTQSGEVQRFATPSQLESIARAGQIAASTMTATR